MTVHSFTATTIRGEEQSLSAYKGQVLLIVNTASKCGFTPQFKGLQELYDQFKEQGFTVLGFPCNQFLKQDPGSSDEIQEFCQINYGVSFPMFEKIDVNGSNAHPLFKYLTKAKKGFLTGGIKWNFTKFLIDRDGNVIERYAPNTDPKDITADIAKLLK